MGTPLNDKLRGKYRIGAVARMTGISAHALRVWERRYQNLEPSRTKGGGRLYSDADVTRFRLIRQLLDRGHSIGQLIQLGAGDLTRTLAMHGATVPPGPIPTMDSLHQRFANAVVSLDLVYADQLLSSAAVGLEPKRLVLEVVVPIIEHFCRRWEAGELRVLHERAATSLLRSQLTTLTRLSLPPDVQRRAVVATPEGEPHEFGALLLAFVAAVHHWKVLYLGAHLEAADLLSAVRTSRAQLLLLSLESDEAPGASKVLRAVNRGLPEEVGLVVSGRGAATQGACLGRAHEVHVLGELEAVLSSAEPVTPEPLRTARKCSM